MREQHVPCSFLKLSLDLIYGYFVGNFKFITCLSYEEQWF